MASPAFAQLRIVDYNIAQNYDIAADPNDGLETIFTAIGAEVRNGFAKPIDVLAVQEADTDGTDAVALAAILNGIYGVTTYAAAPVPGNGVSGGNGLPGLIYNSASVSLIGTMAFGDVGSGSTQQPRSSLRYQLRPAGYDATADFYVYNNHYKSDDSSTDQARRNIEAQGVRANSDAIGEGTHAIYVGDFNVYHSGERTDKDDEPRTSPLTLVSRAGLRSPALLRQLRLCAAPHRHLQSDRRSAHWDEHGVEVDWRRASQRHC